MKNTTAQELGRLLQQSPSPHVIDVRSRFEFARGHVPGAQNIPLMALPQDLPGIAPDEAVVMVCAGGVRSAAACARVEGRYPKVMNLEGGMAAWMRAGLEVEHNPKPAWSLDRQAHLVAGLLLILAFLLSHFVAPAWIYLALLPMFGLTLDGLTGFCPMRVILRACPWNRAAA